MSPSCCDFLTAASAGAVGALVGGSWAATDSVDPVTAVDNPLTSYPTRGGVMTRAPVGHPRKYFNHGLFCTMLDRSTYSSTP